MDLQTLWLFYYLENHGLYTIADVVQTRFARTDPLYRKMLERVRWFVNYNRLTQPESVDGWSGKRGMWYGATLKNQLAAKNYHRAQILTTLPALLRVIVAKRRRQEENQRRRTQADEMETVRDLIDESVARASALKPYQSRWKRSFVATIIFMIIFFAVLFTHRPNTRFLDILKTRGAPEALIYLTMTPEKGRRTYYQAALSDYANGQFAMARRKSFSLLADPNTLISLRADCYYLLGLIASVRDNHYGAQGHFTEAYALFERENRHDALYLCAVEKAKSYLRLNAIPKAEQELARARFQLERCDSVSHGAYLTARFLAALRSKSFKLAIEYAEQAARCFKGEQNNAGLARIQGYLGFVHGLLGDASQAYAYTLESELEAFRLGLYSQHRFNLLNFLILKPGVSSPSLDSMVGWLDRETGDDFQYFLRLALEHRGLSPSR